MLLAVVGSASDPSRAVTLLTLTLALVAVLGVVLAGRGLRHEGVEAVDGAEPERA